MIRISSQFDSGAIEVSSVDSEADVERIDLRIRRDSHQDFTQWFHFRVQGVRGRRCAIRFLNAGACTYPDGWVDYAAVASYDRTDWFRVPTAYRNGVLSIDFVAERDGVWFAYFEPYGWDRHLSLIGRASSSPRVRIAGLGTTHDGRDIDCVDIAEPSVAGAPTSTPKRKVWVIARQHPGETMAEWFVEGLIERLIDASDPVARAALALADFHIVPNMNPDAASEAISGPPRPAPTSTVSGSSRRWSEAPRSSWSGSGWRRPASTCSSTRTATKRCRTTSWPAATGQDPVSAVRLPAELTRQIDIWAEKHAADSRSEAIRRLVEIGLKVKK